MTHVHVKQIDVTALLHALGIDAKRVGRELVALCPFPDHRDSKPSWSIRDQVGGSRHGRHHCFEAATSVLTWDGYQQIGDLVGKSAKVLTVRSDGYPEWVEAPFRSFGEQELWAVTVRRNGVRKVIRATAGHRWFVGRPSEGWKEVTTDCLRAEHRLRSVGFTRSGTLEPSPWGVAHGFTFGDGTRVESRGSRVTLWGEKDAALLKFFPLSPTREVETPLGVEGIEVSGLPRGFKRHPDLDESPSYLYGWLAGYFAADGCVDEQGMPIINSAERANLEFVQRVCIRLGLFTYGIRTQLRRGYGEEESEIHALCFRRSTLSEEFFLIDEHRARWLARRAVKERPGWVVESVERTGETAEVFCAEVPETHCFALEGNILVGNCFSCGAGGGPVSLVCDVLGLGWDDAKEWMLQRGLAGDLPDLAPAVDIAVFGEDRRPFVLPPGCSFRPLEKWVTAARKYAVSRGITPGQVERWGLGYSVDGRLAGRIVIPIYDEQGRLASYTGRTYTDAEARYLHPKREEQADENAVFGSHLWGDRRDRLVLNEGELNALACERAGESCVGALSGSNVTPDAIALLSTFETMIVLTDPDAAGDTAAMKVVHALARWRRCLRIRLPPGTDAAKLEREQLQGILQCATV